MHLHSNATTTLVTRRRIQWAKGTVREIASAFGISTYTVRRWRNREGVEDRSSAPKDPETSIDDMSAQELLTLRKQGLSLDEVFETVMDRMPLLSRSSLYRLFRRNGLGKLSRPTCEATKQFKEYPPGYIHIDCFYCPRIGGVRSYCFVAIDRVTRRTLVGWYKSRTQKAGTDFLRRCIEAFEFKISRILTDNGSEFTNKAYRGPSGKAKRVHDFDVVCAKHGILHRLTKPRTPKTNGLVERQNAIIKNATTRRKTYISLEAMEKDLLAWNTANNSRRQRRIQYRTPLQVSLQWYNEEPQLFKRKPILEAA